LLTAPAQAINITYNFGVADTGGTTISQNVSGVGITLSNLIEDNFNGRFTVDSNGIALSPNVYGTGFSISFDQPITLISYSVTSIAGLRGGDGAFSISNNSTGSSSLNNSRVVG